MKSANAVRDFAPDVHILPAVPNTELYKKYENIITSWGHRGPISKIGLVSSTGSDIPMLGFYEGGVFTMCPAELEEAHEQKVQMIAAFEARISAIVSDTVMKAERYLREDQLA